MGIGQSNLSPDSYDGIIIKPYSEQLEEYVRGPVTD